MKNNTALYERLGLKTDASSGEIKKAHRKLSKLYHPDMGTEKSVFDFRAVQEAYEVLSDPKRRDRYDKTGRTSPSSVTDSHIQSFIDSTISSIINGPEHGQGDPSLENIKERVIASIRGARGSIHGQVHATNRKLFRAKELRKRFKSKGTTDPVLKSIESNMESLMQQLHQHEDALELSFAVEKAFDQYSYEVDPEPEGQANPGSTIRLRGFGVDFTGS